MPTHKDDPFQHRRVLSQAMSELLADPFSELTRKRQVALLIAATVTALLAAGLLIVSEANFANVKFIAILPQLAKWLGFAVTAYLLIAYLLGVWADWAIANAKRWSPLASIEDMKAAMVSEIKDRNEAYIERKEKLERLQNQLHQIQGEIAASFDDDAKW
jgi:hypothetical protein